MHRVDILVLKVTGLSVFDLEDQPYADWFADGLSPLDAAREALQNAGWTNV